VQRGSVQFLSSYPGDPTTPGEPAYANATRVKGGNVPNIPSLPLSWNNARRLFKEIHPSSGSHCESEKRWFVLDGKKSARKVRLVNEVDDRVIPIWNVMGVIPGHIKDEIVLIGNHRDGVCPPVCLMDTPRLVLIKPNSLGHRRC
jgi:N-acetylated-alpha-linked acidic dipeptidase